MSGRLIGRWYAGDAPRGVRFASNPTPLLAYLECDGVPDSTLCIWAGMGLETAMGATAAGILNRDGEGASGARSYNEINFLCITKK